MSIPPLQQLDLLWLRDRAIGSTGVAISIADARLPDLPLVDVNPSFERLTGYSSDEAKGQNCRFLQGPRTDAKAVAVIRNAISSERNVSSVLLNYRKDGTTFWNEVHISPVRDQSGILTHFVGVQHNVTSRERASQQLGLLASLSEIVGRAADPGDTARSITRAVVPVLADLCTVHLAGNDGAPRWAATCGTDQSLVDLTTELESGQPVAAGNASAL